MRQRIIAGCAVLLVVAGSVALHSQSRSSGAVLYEGARLIVGDGSTFETGALLVQGGRITRVGTGGSIPLPTAPGLGFSLDESKVERRTPISL